MSRVLMRAAITLAVLLSGCSADAQRVLEQAEGRWREGNYEDAIRLNTLLYNRERQGPYGAKALLKIGDIYYLNLRKLQDAVDTYNKLKDQYPGRPEEIKARQQLAAIYANEIGDLTQAILEYDRLLEAPELENRSEIRFQRARACFLKGDYDRALRELRQLEADGVTGHLAHQVYLKIGNIYQIQRKYEEAAVCFQKVMDAPCIDCRRRARIHLMETQEALFNFDRAIAVIRSLDRTPENEEVVQREVRRLSEKRRRLDSGQPPSWGAGHRR
jgi:tetratricopeptide (TPR) repeat protein